MKKKYNNSDYNKKTEIFELTKKIVSIDGWSENILVKLVNKNIDNSELAYFFPNGYKDIFKFSLDEINNILEITISKINIINLPLNKRIKKILMTRIEILNKDKKIIKIVRNDWGS